MAGRRGPGGRSLPQLVTDFGGELPSAPPKNKGDRDRHREEAALIRPAAPARGHPRPGHGWSPVAAPLTVYRASTAEIGGVFPLLTANGLPPTGALIGYDALTAGGFYVDPVGWVLNQIVTNPNLIFFGKPGQGKSTTVKALLLRMMLFGARVLVAGDVKGEYEPLCQAVGVEPISLGLGLPVRINPLDLGPLGQGWDKLSTVERQARAALIFARWVVLLKALIGVRGITASPSDESALATVVAELSGWSRGGGQLRAVTIPEVYHALARPTAELAEQCRYSSVQRMVDATRQSTDALGTLVRGALAGLFDAQTTVRLDWNSPIQSLSLRRLNDLGDEVVGVALACVNSWSRAMTDLRRPGEITIVVRDEVWRQMRLGVGAVQSLDADLRLSRNDGEIQVIVAHKPSDLLSVGAAGSQEVAIAKDMMALCDTKVMFAQDPTIADELAELVGLTDIARDWVSGWARQRTGRAVWMVGDRVFKVTTVRTPLEVPLFDTNAALKAEAPT
ncbi:ATP-binding protein [Dactylosporangium sp. NPDC005572]|uniref:ATP-binding protein n=1 Tax=Dactylosporangium sp. NPDC005572 TaxID=3156889 RepID=UPI0033AC8290